MCTNRITISRATCDNGNMWLMNAPRYIGTTALARAFHVSPATVRRWRARGIITPAERLPVSGIVRYDVDQVRRQLAAYEGQPEATEPQTRAPEVETPEGGPVEDMVGTGEAAAAVGLSHSGLAKMANRGQVTPAARVGKRGDMRWDVADLRRQLGQQAEQ